MPVIIRCFAPAPIMTVPQLIACLPNAHLAANPGKIIGFLQIHG